MAKASVNTNRMGGARGHSKPEDIMDLLLKLSRPDDCSQEQSARFLLEWDKARGVHGAAVAPFIAALTNAGRECESAARVEEDAVTRRLIDYIATADKVGECPRSASATGRGGLPRTNHLRLIGCSPCRKWQEQATGLAPDSVRLIHAALRRMLNAAVEDEIIRSNPASGLGRVLRLSRPKSARGEDVRAFDPAQLARFIQAAEVKTPRSYPLFVLRARSGLRLGEALALRWEDLDLLRGKLRVERPLGLSGETDTPKTPRSGSR
jgi:integrase